MIVGSYSEPDYDLFCNNDIVENLNSKKSSLNDIPHEKFTAARSKANPYEKIENYIFINRSAIKLACLDALFSFTRTKRYDPVKDLVSSLWKCSDVHQLWTENLDAMAKDFAHNGIPEDKL
ncbi:2488_t:CDS:2 [Entrophospora sp. SA101]|nr:2488_t:CDS:2 [Entrophospora sp. SA101]